MVDYRWYHRLLLEWEDRYWAKAGRKALAKFEAPGEKPIPREVVQGERRR